MVFLCLRARLKLETSVVKREDTGGKTKRGGPATCVVAEARGCNIKASRWQKEWGNFVRYTANTEHGEELAVW